MSISSTPWTIPWTCRASEWSTTCTCCGRRAASPSAWRGRGVRIVRSAAELAEVPYDRHAPVFAQRYHAPEGRDRKLYVIGDRLFGVKKVFPCRTEAEKHGESFALTPELRDIAARCGWAFGIDLYGVDIVESEGTPYVVDMCSIPGSKGVPAAPRVLAECLYSAAERATRADRVAQSAP